MHNTWLVIQREYLERIRSKAFLIMTLLMPVFMASTILVPALLSNMKSGVTRHIVLIANNREIAEAIKQQLTTPPINTDDATHQRSGHDKSEAPRFAVEINDDTTDAQRDKLRRDISDGKIDGFVSLTDKDLATRKVVYSAKDVT